MYSIHPYWDTALFDTDLPDAISPLQMGRIHDVIEIVHIRLSVANCLRFCGEEDTCDSDFPQAKGLSARAQ